MYSRESQDTTLPVSSSSIYGHQLPPSSDPSPVPRPSSSRHGHQDNMAPQHQSRTQGSAGRTPSSKQSTRSSASAKEDQQTWVIPNYSSSPSEISTEITNQTSPRRVFRRKDTEKKENLLENCNVAHLPYPPGPPLECKWTLYDGRTCHGCICTDAHMEIAHPDSREDWPRKNSTYAHCRWWGCPRKTMLPKNIEAHVRSHYTYAICKHCERYEA